MKDLELDRLQQVEPTPTIKHVNDYSLKNVSDHRVFQTVDSHLRSISVRNMMYGFGDDPQPYAESVELLEDLVVQYITDMVT